MIILKNSVKCNKCKTILVSKTVRAFLTCKCGRVCIAGGNKSLDRYAKDGSYAEKSIIEIDGKKV